MISEDVMKKKFVIILVVIAILLVSGLYLLHWIRKIKSSDLIRIGPCERWIQMYESDYKATSNEKAKSILIDFFNSQNVIFDIDNLNVERITKYYLFTDYYKVSYHICGTMEDFKKIPSTAPFYEEEAQWCSNKTFRVEGYHVIGRFPNPC